MPVHPIEFRYSYPEMYAVFTEEAKLQKWLDVEAALAWAHAQLGTIPEEAAEEIARKGKVGIVKLDRVKEIDREIHHDLMAMVRAFTEVCEGDAGKYIHLGATSYDTEDTALALQLRDALAIMEGALRELLRVLLKQAEDHKETLTIGRTHGQHAVPMTYGMKFAIWASEVARHLDRLDAARGRLLVGKMSGAVGTMASSARPLAPRYPNGTGDSTKCVWISVGMSAMVGMIKVARLSVMGNPCSRINSSISAYPSPITIPPSDCFSAPRGFTI